MPIENILRAYMDESVEHDVSQEVIEEKVEVEVEPEPETKENDTTQKTLTNSENLEDKIKDQEETIKQMVEKNTLTFNDVDKTLDENNKEVEVSAPKTIERLEEISELRNKQRREEEENDDEIFNSNIKINDTPVNLSELDIHDLSDKPKINLEISDPILDDVEVLV